MLVCLEVVLSGRSAFEHSDLGESCVLRLVLCAAPCRAVHVLCICFHEYCGTITLLGNEK